ncbi:hypothetical protein HOA93_01155 [bacterium]|nr:hypothetical protein [bacterium]
MIFLYNLIVSYLSAKYSQSNNTDKVVENHTYCFLSHMNVNFSLFIVLNSTDLSHLNSSIAVNHCNKLSSDGETKPNVNFPVSSE